MKVFLTLHGNRELISGIISPRGVPPESALFRELLIDFSMLEQQEGSVLRHIATARAPPKSEERLFVTAEFCIHLGREGRDGAGFC